MTKELGKKIQIVGDDLFVTNLIRLKKGVKELTANAILIKPNQIGTVTETLEVITFAKKIILIQLFLTDLVIVRILLSLI